MPLESNFDLEGSQSAPHPNWMSRKSERERLRSRLRRQNMSQEQRIAVRERQRIRYRQRRDVMTEEKLSRERERQRIWYRNRRNHLSEAHSSASPVQDGSQAAGIPSTRRDHNLNHHSTSMPEQGQVPPPSSMTAPMNSSVVARSSNHAVDSNVDHVVALLRRLMAAAVNIFGPFSLVPAVDVGGRTMEDSFVDGGTYPALPFLFVLHALLKYTVLHEGKITIFPSKVPEMFFLSVRLRRLTVRFTVTSVRTPIRVVDALNAEGRDINIIHAKVELPVTKSVKMYVLPDEELRRILIIMMSAQDEVSVGVKCLKLGAADYLVKPLHTNELLNLWTHMRRRQHMLGLSEKKLLSCDFDAVVSDPSNANTNSTTLFSDETDDKFRRSTILERSISNHREEECNAAASIDPALNSSSAYELRFNEQLAPFSSCPKKSELRIGESSAFFRYVKSSERQRSGRIDECAAPEEDSSKQEKHTTIEAAQVDVSGLRTRASFPTSAQLFGGNQQDVGNHTTLAIMPRYNFLQLPMMTPFPFYPMCMQTGRTATSSSWAEKERSVSGQKRKDRCFDKKIRCINRKRLVKIEEDDEDDECNTPM